MCVNYHRKTMENQGLFHSLKYNLTLDMMISIAHKMNVSIASYSYNVAMCIDMLYSYMYIYSRPSVIRPPMYFVILKSVQVSEFVWISELSDKTLAQ